MDLQYEGAMSPEPPSGPPLLLKRFLTFLLKYWWVPAATLLLCFAAATVYIFFIPKPPLFISTARMWETGKMRLPEGNLFSEDVQNFTGTQIELLQSGRLRQLALDQLQGAGTNAVPLGKDGLPLEVDIGVRQSTKSSVFLIQATSSDRNFTQSYLNALLAAYLEYKRGLRQTASGETLASISDQVKRLETQLKAEQDILATYQTTNNLAVLEEESTVAGGNLARLKSQQSDLILETKILEATLNGAAPTNSAGTNPALSLVSAFSEGSSSAPGGSSMEMQSSFKELQLLKLQRQRFSKYLRPKHPKMVNLDGQIERAEKIITVFQEQVRDQNRERLIANRHTLKLKLESIEASIAECKERVTAANSRLGEAARLKSNVSRTQSLFDRLATLVQNVTISRNIDQETLSILEPASPALPLGQGSVRILVMAFLGGTVLGLGVVLLLAVLDDRLFSLHEVNQKLGGPVLGQLPEIRTKRRQHEALPLLEEGDARHTLAESYRNLRSALLFMPSFGERPKVLLFTSAIPNEGKSTIAANLARTLALGGSRVLLVDGDLRKGVLHNLLGMQREPGLSDLLRQPEALEQDPCDGQVTLSPEPRLERFIQTNSLPNFSFIASGSLASNTGELFLGPAFDRVMSHLREQFDYVLIDSSPVFAADDVTTLAPKVDGTLFVVRDRYSRARPAREALELLFQRQVKILGLIFNRADPASRSYYAYKYNGYHPAAGPGKDEPAAISI